MFFGVSFEEKSVIQFFDQVLFYDSGIDHPVQQSFHGVVGFQEAREIHDEPQILFRNRGPAISRWIRLKSCKIISDKSSDKMELCESISIIFFFHIHFFYLLSKKSWGKIAADFVFASRKICGFCFFLLESRWIRLLCVPLYFFILTLNSYYLNGTDPFESFSETDSGACAGIRLVAIMSCDHFCVMVFKKISQKILLHKIGKNSLHR